MKNKSTKQKKKISKKSKILMATLIPASVLVIASGSVIGGIAGIKLGQLAQEQTAFNGAYLLGNQSPVNPNILFDKGLVDDEAKEAALPAASAKFFTTTNDVSKTISVDTFSQNLQTHMLKLFEPFLIKLQQLHDQLDASPLAAFPLARTISDGFAVDALNLIKAYLAEMATTDSLKYQKAFITFDKGLGSLIEKYMVQAFGSQITPNGDFAQYAAGKSDGQNLLIDLFYDHVLLNIAGGLFREATEAPAKMIESLVARGFHAQKSTSEADKKIALGWTAILAGKVGIDHMADLSMLSNAFDGVTWVMNKNLADVLSHPIFHGNQNRDDKIVISQGMTLFTDLFNEYILVPTSSSTEMADALQVFIKTGIASTSSNQAISSGVLAIQGPLLGTFMNNYFTSGNFDWLMNESINSSELYTNATNLRCFMQENIDHFSNNNYFNAVTNLYSSNNW